MKTKPDFDISVVGGGLAGLSTAIALRKKGFQVALFEKENYPYHKVCGEYIAMESFPWLTHLLGYNPIETLSLPVIERIVITAPSGYTIQKKLQVGGFGISRYVLDHLLFEKALSLGVKICTQTTIEDIYFDAQQDLMYLIDTYKNLYVSKVCVGAYGKKSNLDVKLGRKFVQSTPSTKHNYIGVKYHIEYDIPLNQIALHNFKDGYAGISKIEGGKTCFCYLTSAKNLKSAHGSIDLMENLVLSKNPHIADILTRGKKIWQKPMTISQIRFEPKETIHKHIIMCGDTAGLIAPLTGNGMSLAMYTASLATYWIADFLQGIITRTHMENGYASEWRTQCATRLTVSRWIQHIFGKTWQTELVIRSVGALPILFDYLEAQTHGEKF